MSLDPGRLSPRKRAILARAERQARERPDWIARNAYYYEEDRRYLDFLVPPGASVLELGCGIGDSLAALRPSRGVGVDFSQAMLEVAKARYPFLEFHEGDVEDPATLDRLGGPFDVILVSDTIGELEDCQTTLRQLHKLCSSDTRVIISYYSAMWEPILELAEWMGQKMQLEPQNWLSSDDISALVELAGFEVVKREWRQLIPKRCFGFGRFVNRYIAPLPLVRRLALRNYVVARPHPKEDSSLLSATVLIPCKNERDNIEPAIQRLPRFCEDLEILFVEGGSTDGTRPEIERVIDAYPERNIRVLTQRGKGKGDAVRTGFEAASGDVLIILDADLTVAPEWIPRFHEAIRSGRGEFINGSRLVYPMEDQAMRFLNLVANRVFCWLFSWLLNQRFTDTLCGTKALSKHHYREIAANRDYFGDFDPFGDFDLIFGAAKLNLKVVEVPVRYASRRYGETQISRFRHGWLLLRMVIFAFRKLKAF
ncbi:MAG TPA: glycosyltransferase [Alphaproteobacteria bacterium]|nr:glycosyltransferase [Alphaproteobacteria bacterium]